eukprot:TRINITY_DN1045_c0_g1_i1.p1 TRINITY_DN1045_c0_g1~~TRINITY_DN1045_c0_g1_i1.p1  ORF type:complete len:611 (+),score=124.65 TRINITY_DN1045_c0_g1_i1:65-1897(+)
MSSALDEFDLLLNEVENVSVSAGRGRGAPISSGPGARSGVVSSGPGMVSSGPGMVSSGPGMVSSGPGMVSSGPGMVSSGPGMVSSGPAGRGYSSGPGISAGRGYSSGPGVVSSGPGVGVSSGPGVGGVGVVSSGPGVVSSGPGVGAGRGFSSGPGVSAGRGYATGPGVSNGPGVMSAGPGAPVSAGPGLMSSGPGAISSGPGQSAGRGFATGNPQINPAAMPMQVGGLSHGPGVLSSGPGLAAGPPSLTATQGFQNHTPAEQTPDGRKIIYNGPPCAYCGQMIFGKILNALEQTWHPEHFFCTHCSQPFKDGQFLAHEGKPYCVNDFNDLFAPKCERCTLPITSKKIVFKGRNYHSEHFQCTGCGTSLIGKTPKDEDGYPFCSKCKEQREKRVEAPAHLCAKCKLPIIGEYITLKGQKLHPEHYRCQACGCEFNAGNCHEYEGNLYCYEDYVKLIKDVCFACKKPIPGRSLTAMGRVWHPEHFVCAFCHEPFPGMVFREHDGKPYCEQHYQMLQCPPCVKCGLAVVGGGKSAFGHTWHKEHFVCTGCEKSLIGKTLRAWEQKLYCSKCYDDLPADLRKQIEKKYQQEQKMKKIREKEAAKEEKSIAKKSK